MFRFILLLALIPAVLPAQNADSVYVDENGMVVGEVEKVKNLPVEIGPGMDYLIDHNRMALNGFTPGMTPLMHLARTAGTKELMEALKAGAPVDAVDLAGKTAFHHAAEAGNKEALYILFQHYADPGSTDNAGETVLHKAARAGNADLIRVFLSLGVQPDVADKMGVTALMRAAAQGHYDACVALAKGGASAQLEDNNGNTLLHAWAAGLVARRQAVSRVVVTKGPVKSKPAAEPEPDPDADGEEAEGIPEKPKKKKSAPKKGGKSTSAIDPRWKPFFKALKCAPDVKNADGLSPIEFAQKAGREDISATLQLLR